MLALWGETPLSVGRIGSLLQLDSPTLSPLLKRLQAAGLITRTRSGDDERQVLIDLTDDGRALREKALAIPPAVVEKLGMEIPELEALHAALTRVIVAANDLKGGVRKRWAGTAIKVAGISGPDAGPKARTARPRRRRSRRPRQGRLEASTEELRTFWGLGGTCPAARDTRRSDRF